MRDVVTVASILLGLGVEAKASCTPTALVRGPDDVVATITRTLVSRGIATEAVEGCPFVRATITVNGAALSVTIEDPYGRTHAHVLADADAVATLIESWTDPRDETPLLAARGWSSPRRPQIEADTDTPAVLASHSDPVRMLGGAVAVETSLGSDGSSWWGAAGAMCVRLDRICAGANVRFASDARLSGSSENLKTGRTAFDLLLGVDVPLQRGDLQVTFGAGVGLGWIRSSVMGPGGAVDVDAGGLRTDAHVTVELPITATLSAELRGVVNLSPLAHVGTYTEDGSTLAGEPRGFARVSVGLRYGAR